MNGFEPFLKRANSGIGFGDGSDGNAVISSAVSWNSTTGVDHTGFVVKQFKNLTVTNTGIITPSHFNKGMFIFCRGDCNLNGTISNALMGSTSTDTSGFVRINLKMLPERMFANYKTGGVFDVSATSNQLLGANPGVGQAGVTNVNGVAGVNGQCGGGGAGSTGIGAGGGIGGSGSQGLPFAGGAGGGSIGYCGTGCSTNGQNAVGPAGGGPSGDGRWGSGGGAGNPIGLSQDSGYGGAATQAQLGLGGCIWIFVRGTLTFGPNMRIYTNGGNGGRAAMGNGGGSGGGSIAIFYKKALVTNVGYLLNADGGIGGGNGGAGSIVGPMKVNKWS